MPLNVRLNDAQQALILRRMDDLAEALAHGLPREVVLDRYRRARSTLDYAFGKIAPSYREAVPVAARKPESVRNEEVVLDYIKRYIERVGYAPTVKEISDGTARAHGTVQNTINRLVASGRLEQGQGTRSLRLGG